MIVRKEETRVTILAAFYPIENLQVNLLGWKRWKEMRRRKRLSWNEGRKSKNL